MINSTKINMMKIQFNPSTVCVMQIKDVASSTWIFDPQLSTPSDNV